MTKLIITIAPTGSIPTKKNNPNVPISPDEIIQTGILCEKAGASIIHIHARQLPMCIHAIAMGGHTRVGLEDCIYFRKGELASNEQLVKRIVQVSQIMGREIATPDEARQILGLI